MRQQKPITQTTLRRVAALCIAIAVIGCSKKEDGQSQAATKKEVELQQAAATQTAELVLPNRLSCDGTDSPPTVWENGRIHFDFTNGTMLLNASQKMYAGSARKEAPDRVIFFDKVLEAATGRVTPLNHWVRVSPNASLKGNVFRVTITSSFNPELALTCLGQES